MCIRDRVDTGMRDDGQAKKGQKKASPGSDTTKTKHTKCSIHTGYTKGGVKSSGRYGIQPARRWFAGTKAVLREVRRHYWAKRAIHRLWRRLMVFKLLCKMERGAYKMELKRASRGYIRGTYKAVSYTHLDVYKRQLLVYLLDFSLKGGFVNSRRLLDRGNYLVQTIIINTHMLYFVKNKFI